MGIRKTATHFIIGMIFPFTLYSMDKISLPENKELERITRKLAELDQFIATHSPESPDPQDSLPKLTAQEVELGKEIIMMSYAPFIRRALMQIVTPRFVYDQIFLAAVRNGKIDTVKKFLQIGIENIVKFMALEEMMDQEIADTEKDRIIDEIILLIIQSGLSTSTKNHIFEKAVNKNRTQIVEYLLKNGISEFEKSQALEIAVRETNKLPIVKMLLDYGIKDIADAITIAAKNENIEAIDLLIVETVDTYYKDLALQIAVNKGNLRLIDAVLKGGLTPPYINNAFKLAEKAGNYRIIERLRKEMA